MSQCDGFGDVRTLADTLDMLEDLALSHARESGPYRDHLVALISNRDWPALCAYEPDYSINASVTHVTHMRQALGFYTKLEDLDIGVDKEQAA